LRLNLYTKLIKTINCISVEIWDQAGWCGCYIPELAILSEVFHGFPQSHQANDTIVLPKPSPSKFLPTLHSQLSSHPFHSYVTSILGVCFIW
jgi:hypothetical protein